MSPSLTFTCGSPAYPSEERLEVQPHPRDAVLEREGLEEGGERRRREPTPHVARALQVGTDVEPDRVAVAARLSGPSRDHERDATAGVHREADRAHLGAAAASGVAPQPYANEPAAESGATTVACCGARGSTQPKKSVCVHLSDVH